MGQLFGCYFVQLYAQASYFRLIACTQLFLYVKVSATLQPYGCDQKTAGHQCQVRGTARFLFDGGEARCIIYISAGTFFESTYSYNFIHLLISSLSVYSYRDSEWFRMVQNDSFLQDLQSSCFVARCSSMGNSLSMASTARTLRTLPCWHNADPLWRLTLGPFGTRAASD